jgi:hypothetical protein
MIVLLLHSNSCPSALHCKQAAGECQCLCDEMFTSCGRSEEEASESSRKTSGPDKGYLDATVSGNSAAGAAAGGLRMMAVNNHSLFRLGCTRCRTSNSSLH